jgi:alpha-ketoglutarate-dependent taurine dioxygenase
MHPGSIEGQKMVISIRNLDATLSAEIDGIDVSKPLPQADIDAIEAAVDLPPKAAVLHALEVPPPEAGGNTYFANMFEAYETLPADMKKAADGRIAVHDASRNSAGVLRKGYKEITDVRETPGAHHPLVRTDPKSGRKALFLGRRPSAYVLDLEVAESEALLDALWAHATQPRFVMCHRWKVGDLVMWNNLSVLHRRDPFDPKTRRVMHRSQIKGNERIA